MQFGNIKAKLVYSVVASLVVLGFGYNEVYADVPNIDTFVANDPDDGDVIYSVGDTFTLTFNLPINVTASATMSQGAIDGNFTLSAGSFGVAYTGLWSADTRTLTITVNTAGGGPPTIGVDTISASAGSNLGHAGDLPTAATLTGSPTLAGDYGVIIAGGGGGGSVPSGGYQPPTMGVTKQGMVLVEDGFSYNNKPVDVHLMNTPYPLVTTKVGEENVAKLKIYSPRGIDRLQHVALAFGLDKYQIFGESDVVLEWNKLPNGEETLTVIDSKNYLENVKAVTSEGKCRSNGNDQCFIIEFFHTFRQPLQYNIMGTYIWDDKRSGWQNYYNDGVEIIGDSLNPPNQYEIVYHGQPFTITEIDRNKGVDQEGNSWTFDVDWQMDYVPKAKIDDGMTSHGIDRNNAKFNSYKNGQALIAEYVLKTSTDGSLILSKEVDKAQSFDFDFITRSNNVMLQKLIENEINRAEQRFSDYFVVDANDEFNKYLKIYQQYIEENYRN